MKALIPAFAALLVAAAAASPAAALQDGSAVTTTVPADALTISTYYNVDVYDQQDNKIGDVNDILLDKAGKVQAVIVGVGGFIGVGEKDVAVPFSALKVADKNGKRYLVMNASKEALESAPGYTYDRNQGVWKPVAKS
jgi:sporulation protein YlmC with PRC-barrel domain